MYMKRIQILVIVVFSMSMLLIGFLFGQGFMIDQCIENVDAQYRIVFEEEFIDLYGINVSNLLVNTSSGFD